MRTVALIKRILLQIVRDWRTLALLFIAPLLVLTLMNFVFNGNTVNPVLGVVNGSPQFIEKLQEAEIEVQPYDSVSDVKRTIVDDELDGLLQIAGEQLTLTLQNDEPTIAKTLEVKVKQIYSQLQQQPSMQAIQVQTQDIIETDYVYGSSDTVLFDTFSPILVGVFVFLFVFIISGIGLLNERTTGTLERLLATPIRRGEIVTGYLVSYGLVALIQTVIVVLFSVNVLDMVLVGSIWNVIFINIIIAFVALSLGTLLSAFASSEFQMIQFIPLVIVPQIFLSGIFSLEGMANGLQLLAHFMPLYYGANALKGVMYEGASLVDISNNLYILLAFAGVFIILNLFALKKYRKL